MAEAARIGFGRALWLLLRLQLIRLRRQLSAGFRVFSRKKVDGKRTATAPKSRGGLVLGALLVVAMFFGFISIAQQSVNNIRNHAETAAISTETIPGDTTAGLPAESGVADRMVRISHLATLLLLAAITLFTIGNGELVRPDWDLEWLATLPISMAALIHTRILTRAVINPSGYLFLWPFLSALAWQESGFLTALVSGFFATFCLLVVAATVQTLCDTGLKLRLSPAQLRNLQAAISIAGVIALYLGLSPGMPSGSGLVGRWALALPSWALWLPPGLAVQAMTGSTWPAGLGLLGLLAAEVILFAALGAALLKRELRHGIIAGGGREAARRSAAKETAAQPARARLASRRLLLTPIQARELLLLGRDRNFLVQTLVLPVIMIGAQVLFNGGGSAIFSSVYDSPQIIASVTFGIAAYALMFSAFQTLNTEGQALWILYSVPQSLESVLRQKAILWGTLCLIYPLAMFGYIFATQPVMPPRLIELAIFVLIGIPVLATIATSLGVFACDPLSPNVQRRVKISYSYLYFLLSSIYAYALYANTLWQRIALLILTTSLALALWQKARDRLPYILDPVASPPARVSVSDGLIAAQLFFVIQGIVGLIVSRGAERLAGSDMLIAFSIAGAVTFIAMRFAFWRLKAEGVPRTFGRGAGRAMAAGAVAGSAAAGLAYIYLFLTPLPALFEAPSESLVPSGEDALMFAILAIAAAPLFEEFIFRGLVYGGLRRSLGVTASILASAALFAIVHPPVGFVPVFAVGVATALVYERSRMLIGPMTVHAVYNGFILGFQFLG
jgi:ABC-2 type transport system permease protein